MAFTTSHASANLKIDDLCIQLREAREHAEQLDKNWNTHHEACMNTFRAALLMGPDATVTEILKELADILHRLMVAERNVM